MPHEINKSLTWRVAWYGRERHFLIRHFPLPWRGLASRRRHRIFAGQFAIGQPFSEDGTGCFDEALRIIAFALVISKRLFVQVAKQVEGTLT